MIENIYITYCQDGSRLNLKATCNGDIHKTFLSPPKRPATVSNIVHSMGYLVKKISHDLITRIPEEARDVLIDLVRGNDDGYTVFDSHGYTIYLHIKCTTYTHRQKRYSNDTIKHTFTRTKNFPDQSIDREWI